MPVPPSVTQTGAPSPRRALVESDAALFDVIVGAPLSSRPRLHSPPLDRRRTSRRGGFEP
jgi:hypothetical protein